MDSQCWASMPMQLVDATGATREAMQEEASVVGQPTTTSSNRGSPAVAGKTGPARKRRVGETQMVSERARGFGTEEAQAALTHLLHPSSNERNGLRDTEAEDRAVRG